MKISALIRNKNTLRFKREGILRARVRRYPRTSVYILRLHHLKVKSLSLYKKIYNVI